MMVYILMDYLSKEHDGIARGENDKAKEFNWGVLSDDEK